MKSVNSEFVSIEQLIKDFKEINVRIPLLQRNYKWTLDNGTKLLGDIISAKEGDKPEYTIGMATFYRKNDNNNEIVEIIDGQQRMITLSLLMKALGKNDSFIYISFERDTDKERTKFLKFDEIGDHKFNGVDVLHMKSMYDKFVEAIRDINEKEELFDWIMKKVKIIRRYTDSEPLQEFLNLNEKKTPFSSTDYDRAYQLKYQALKQEITPDMILKLHNSIEKHLYQNMEIFELISYRYSKSEFKNRMDLLFLNIKANFDNLSGYYQEIDKDKEKDEKYKQSYIYLEYCNKVFKSISQELQQSNNNYLNVNVYNAISMLYKLDKNFRFFDLIDKDDTDISKFEKKLSKRFNLLEQTYDVAKNRKINAFMESQLNNSKDSLSDNDEYTYKKHNHVYSEEEQYFDEELKAIFETKLNETIEFIEAGKNYSELINGGKKSFQEILELEEIRQIIIPKIQRDYTLGSDEEALIGNEKSGKKEGLLLALSKSYIKKCISKKQYSNTTFKIIQYYLRQVKVWNEITPSHYKETCRKQIQMLNIASGQSIDVDKYDWRYVGIKDYFYNMLASLRSTLSLTPEDFSSMKTGEYFDSNHPSDIFLFSVIFGNLENGNFYLYDGQQRIVTLIYLAAFILNQTVTISERKNSKEVKLLSKFRFEDRKEANDILLKLLYEDKVVSLGELKKYITDHSTYSIYCLLNTYDKYENGYEKMVLSFDLSFLMSKVIFEFATVEKSSLADQLYLDLNSKNMPLTAYENYKAELVYILSTKYTNQYNKYWKYQLDNEYLNACFGDKDSWNACDADNAEKKEIQLIHWCFKMLCMEYEIEIGNIDEPKNRLRWMEEDANIIVERASLIVNQITFEYIDRISSIMQEDVKKYSLAELVLWNEIRMPKELKEFQYAFENNAVTLQVNNLSGKELKWLFKYVYKLGKAKEQDDTKIIKFLLKECHTYWEENYLECELLNDNESQNEEETKISLDYFSDKYLINIPKEFANEWVRYIYCVKLNERLDSIHYEKVRDWEEEEAQSEKDIFTFEEKEKSKRYNYNYEIWKKFNEYEQDYNTRKIDKHVENQKKIGEIINKVISEIENVEFEKSRFFDKKNIQIEIQFLEESDFMENVMNYINSENISIDSEICKTILNELHKLYFIDENFIIWKYNSINHIFEDIDELTPLNLKWLEITNSKIKEKFKESKNSDSLEKIYYWINNKNKKFKEIIGENINEKTFGQLVELLNWDLDKFKNYCKEQYGKVQDLSFMEG